MFWGAAIGVPPIRPACSPMRQRRIRLAISSDVAHKKKKIKKNDLQVSQNLFFVIILCVCIVAALDMRRKRCTHLASHNGLSTDYHTVWAAPWSGNAIAVSGRGCRGLRVTLARHILDTHFFTRLERGKGVVCQAARLQG